MSRDPSDKPGVRNNLSWSGRVSVSTAVGGLTRSSSNAHPVPGMDYLVIKIFII